MDDWRLTTGGNKSRSATFLLLSTAISANVPLLSCCSHRRYNIRGSSPIVVLRKRFPLDVTPDAVEHLFEAIVEVVAPSPGRHANAINCHDKRQTTGDWNGPLATCDCRPCMQHHIIKQLLHLELGAKLNNERF